jgi:nucleotide-binding universal stress UspA family protein
MSDFSRVLCAIDLTEPSRRVLDCALWWARRHDADVSVLHVHRLAVPPPDTGSIPGDPGTAAAVPPVGEAPLEPEEHSARQLELEEFVQHARTDGLQIEVLLEENASVADAIAARADALAADLVVVGAGTDRTSEHPVLGRVTSDLLRAAPCSVLVVPAPAADVANPAFNGLNRVLCAVSLSDQSPQVLECASALAAESAAHLSVVHVVELFSEVAALAYDFDAHREARIQPACDALVTLVASVVGRDKPVEEVVAQGTGCDEILKIAREESPDLIVVGQGSGRRARGVGRPTGQAVAREARCPVLFVHAEPPSVGIQKESLSASRGSTDAAR